MAKFSFDVVSEVDLQEMDNAVNQAKKDELQVVIAHLKGLKFPIPLSFCNYR
ncbi:MAG: DUF520 family protein [Candidatus Omnitrophica bacterium]|nr:DUF520 family protein [Candidatus Omnitrophota bacterium]